MNSAISFILLTTFSIAIVYCSYSTSIRHCHKAAVHKHKNSKAFFGFIKKYKKHYKTAQECLERFENFKRTYSAIKHVKEGIKGSGKYGITSMADFSHKDSDYMPEHYGFKVKTPYTQELPPKPIPNEFDWRQLGAVNPVPTQGLCASSYAFAAIGNIEGVYFAATKKLPCLSVQQIVDCDQQSSLCHDGNIESAALYLLKLGAMTARDYPYTAMNQTCFYDRKRIFVKAKDVLGLNYKKPLEQFLFNYGPLSAFVNGACLQMYQKGIFYDLNSVQLPLIPHYVLLVGYGVKHYNGNTSLPYWIARNSMGTGWGEKGYFRIARGIDMCKLGFIALTVVM